MQDTPDSLDIDLMDTAGRETDCMNIPAPTGVHVGRIAHGAIPTCFDAGVLASIWKHIMSDGSTELGGVLLGKYRAGDQAFVWIRANLVANHTVSTVGSLTFTHETWAEIAEQLEAKHSELAIMGWYHSHPGHGIFLSSFDRFIHEGFFSGRHQSALVLDPMSKDIGLFQWSESGLDRSGYVLVCAEHEPSPCPERHVADPLPQSRMEESCPAHLDSASCQTHNGRLRSGCVYSADGKATELPGPTGCVFTEEA